MSEVIETKNSSLWLGDDGIIRARQKPLADNSLKDMIDFVTAFERLADGKPRPLLADIGGIKSITKEARKFVTGDDPVKMMLSAAIIVGSPVSRLIGNFFLGLNRPKIPVKLFDSEEKGVEWLKEQIE